MGLSSGLPGMPAEIRSTAKLAGFALRIAWLTINSDLVLLSNATAKRCHYKRRAAQQIHLQLWYYADAQVNPVRFFPLLFPYELL